MKAVKIILAASLLAATPSVVFAKGWDVHGWASPDHFNWCPWQTRVVPCFVASRWANDF